MSSLFLYFLLTRCYLVIHNQNRSNTSIDILRQYQLNASAICHIYVESDSWGTFPAISHIESHMRLRSFKFGWKVDAAEMHGLASTTVPTMAFGRVADTKQPYTVMPTRMAAASQWNCPCVHHPFVMLIEAADLHNKTIHMDRSTILMSAQHLSHYIEIQSIHCTFSLTLFQECNSRHAMDSFFYYCSYSSVVWLVTNVIIWFNCTEVALDVNWAEDCIQRSVYICTHTWFSNWLLQLRVRDTFYLRDVRTFKMPLLRNDCEYRSNSYYH